MFGGYLAFPNGAPPRPQLAPNLISDFSISDGYGGDIWRANFSSWSPCPRMAPANPPSLPPQIPPTQPPIQPPVGSPILEPAVEPASSPLGQTPTLPSPVAVVPPPQMTAVPDGGAPMLAPLASPGNSSSVASSQTNVGAIVGGVVAGSAGAAGIGFGLFFFCVVIPRRRMNKTNSTEVTQTAAAGSTNYGNMGSAVEMDDKKQNRKRAATRKEELIQAFKPEWMIPFSDVTFGKKLGQGAFGVVYAGKWRKSTDVAIKQSTVLCVDDAAIDAFKAEALLMLELRPHPSCVQVLGVCVEDTMVYVIMELCEGGSLSSLMEKQSISQHEKLQIISTLAAGIQVRFASTPMGSFRYSFFWNSASALLRDYSSRYCRSKYSSVCGQ
jgi:hypothetical protein